METLPLTAPIEPLETHHPNRITELQSYPQLQQNNDEFGITGRIKYLCPNNRNEVVLLTAVKDVIDIGRLRCISIFPSVLYKYKFILFIIISLTFKAIRKALFASSIDGS